MDLQRNDRTAIEAEIGAPSLGKDHARAPAVPEVGVVALVPESWSQPWTTRHHFLTRLASYFNVLWVEPPLHWRNISFDEIRRHARGRPAMEPVSGMRILNASPWHPKFFWPSALASAMERLRVEKAGRVLRDAGSTNIVLYLWRPEFAKALDYLQHSLSCYHIDDEYSFSSVPADLDPREVELIERVDRVFIHSERLMAMKGHFNQATSLVPNGVDFERYSLPREVPADLMAIRCPRVGYVGVIKQQLNLDLIAELARSRTNWSFVFIGPVLTIGDQVGALAQLERMPNVHLLGPKDVAELPAYTQHLDVCLLPYKIDAYTNLIYPLKLNEYLAAGRPVVGSRIAALEGLDGIAVTAGSVDEWVRGIENALSSEASISVNRQRRLEYANQHDWNRLVRGVATSIIEAIGSEKRNEWIAAIDAVEK